MMRVLQAIAVAGVAAATSVANAAVVTTWDYTVTSVFDTSTTCFTTGCAPQANTTNNTNAITWGVPASSNGQSSLVITDSPANGSLNTTTPPFSTPLLLDGEIGPTQTFTHNNWPIFSPFLLNVDVTTTLTLKPAIPAQPSLPAFPSLTFNINFAETTNSGDPVGGSGNCTTDPDYPKTDGCPDIFVIGGGLNNFSFFYDTDGAGGDPAQEYFVQIFPLAGTPLDPLPDAVCLRANAPTGCLGFVTQENQSNSVQFAFALTTEPFGEQVPEPGTLALFAAALVGLGFTVRSRRA